MRHCKHCKADFEPTRRWQRFCSAACRRDHNRKSTATTGPIGTIKVVRQLKCGVSITAHFTDQKQAERVVRMLPGTSIALTVP